MAQTTSAVAPGWNHIWRIWWAILWRNLLCTLGSMLAGGLLGGIVGGFLGAFGASTLVIQIVSGSIGFVIGICASIVPFKFILNKRIGSFELILLSNSGERITPGLSHIIRVWWAYVWRNLLFTVGVGVAAFLIGGVIGFLAALVGIRHSMILNWFLGISGGLGGLALSVYPVDWVVGHDFGDFKLAVINIDSE